MMQILTDPCIIFCDEPTTGLDSFSALSVVQTLRNFAHSKLVICSIHQPTSEVFQYFTHIILMRSGAVAFQGGLRQVVQAFARSGRICPRAYNVADFLVKSIADPSFELKAGANDVNDEVIVHQPPTGCWSDNAQPINTVGWLKQVSILLRRLSRESRRTVKEFMYKLTTFVVSMENNSLSRLQPFK